MLFFHKKNPPARPAGLNWYWTLTVDGMPAADFDWPDLLRGLDRLRPDRDSYVALERMDPNDPREAGFLQCTATPEGRDLLERFAEQCAETANLDKAPKLEGRMMSIFLSPKPNK